MADFNTEIEQMKAESLKQLEKDIASKPVQLGLLQKKQPMAM